MAEITAAFRNTIILMMVLFGSLNTLGKWLADSAYRFQNRQLVYEGSYFKYFYHPYMQVHKHSHSGRLHVLR
jgi:hypothetical protein